MIKVNELRIGNLVRNKFHHKLPEILEVSLSELSVIDMFDNLGHSIPFKSIPLTEEWLLKFGWSYYNGKTTGVLTKDTSCKLDLDFYKNKIQIKSHYEGYEFYRDLKINYVHQLQNLYFTLTGTELTIKE